MVINENLVDSDSETYNVNLIWSKPDLLPAYYIAHFINVDPQSHNKTDAFVNITGVSLIDIPVTFSDCLL